MLTFVTTPTQSQIHLNADLMMALHDSQGSGDYNMRGCVRLPKMHGDLTKHKLEDQRLLFVLSSLTYSCQYNALSSGFKEPHSCSKALPSFLFFTGDEMSFDFSFIW